MNNSLVIWKKNYEEQKTHWQFYFLSVFRTHCLFGIYFLVRLIIGASTFGKGKVAIHGTWIVVGIVAPVLVNTWDCHMSRLGSGDHITFRDPATSI